MSFHFIMKTILSSLSFTLGETILINVLFWLVIICVIVLLVWSLKFTKDDWKDLDGHNPMLPW